MSLDTTPVRYQSAMPPMMPVKPRITSMYTSQAAASEGFTYTIGNCN